MQTWTVYWPKWMLELVVRQGLAGAPLRLVWGGWNQATRFNTKVRPGDRFFALASRHASLYVVGTMVVETREEVDDYLAVHPEDQALRPDACSGVVIAGREGTPIRFDTALPPGLLQQWEFLYADNKRTRPLKGLSPEGHVGNPDHLMGAYRTTPDTSRRILACLRGEREPLTGILGQLVARASEAPSDLERALVLADAWMEADDPRGTALRIEHELTQATTKKAARAARKKLAEMVDEEPEALLGRPGGYPFRWSWGIPLEV